jgi:hypothetical protein
VDNVIALDWSFIVFIVFGRSRPIGKFTLLERHPVVFSRFRIRQTNSLTPNGHPGINKSPKQVAAI